MKPVRKLNDLVKVAVDRGRKKTAIACAEDINTLQAVAEALKIGLIYPVMIGNSEKITELCKEYGINTDEIEIIDEKNDEKAAVKAVELVKNGDADILMKGLVGTDKFLRAVLDKKKGLLPKGNVMSYVCALEIPKYDKLLFISDPAVIPFPDLKQKISMVNYAVNMALKFGIETPKVSLVNASEKVSANQENTLDDAVICKMADRGQIKNCLIDGPLDLFLSCDPESVKIKKTDTPINGEADILIFPSIEACNSFYKGLMLFAGGELAGLIQGTEKPVVVMSRSESPASKLYCIALAVLMANPGGE
ncbi:MAG: phosphate acetyltransferase [Candidatus Cloacimonadota bacterium]|nr:MAG: phosphate acetyltransferase [Candidatus Cloacimonadota bacterium]